LHKLADVLLKQGEDGNIQALKEIGDRIDGKAHQSTDIQIDGNITLEQQIFGNPDKAAKPMESS